MFLKAQKQFYGSDKTSEGNRPRWYSKTNLFSFRNYCDNFFE